MKKLILKEHINPDLLVRVLRWHLRYYLRRRGLPVSCGVLVTNQCNSRCVMCTIWQNREVRIFPLQDHLESIDVLADLGCYYYSLSGGEPTLMKDLVDRLAYAAKRIPYVHAVTNGLTMDRELAAGLGRTGIKELSISIDGDERFHNFLRGRPDAYERAQRALDLVRTHAPDLKIVVNSVLTRYNVQAVRELNKLLQGRDRVFHKLLPISHHDIFNNADIAIHRFSGFDEIGLDGMEQFLRESARNPKIVNSKAFLLKAISYFRGEKDLLAEQRSCLYPYHGLDITHDGDAYPCYGGKAVSASHGRADRTLRAYLLSEEYRQAQRKLRSCPQCNGNMMLCYYEPRLNYPLHNFLRYSLRGILS